jgi:hypothetical protein
MLSLARAEPVLICIFEHNFFVLGITCDTDIFIFRIENALDKVLLLRGVEYNDIRIEPDKKKIGLIAQEVELIIPEDVGIDEATTIKNIEYGSLVDFKYDSTYFEVGTNNIFKPSFLCSRINTGTLLSWNASKLKLDYDDEFTTVSNKLRINLVR